MSGVLQRADGVVVRALDDELLVLLPDRQGVVHLDPTATAVWQLLAQPRTTEDLVAALGSAYPEAGARLEADLEALLAALEEQGAVRRAP